MNKTIRFFILLAAVIVAVPSALAAEPNSYYDKALNKSDYNLMSSLCNIIHSHKQLSYGALWDAFKSTDTDSQGYIIDMYSNCRYRPNEHGASAQNVGDGFNREHSFPKSWFDDGYPMYTDLFHLYPTDIKVNSQRSNYPFGVCANGTRLVNGSLHGKGKLGQSTYPGYSGTVFEPDDEYKGDFARTYFYMVTCYMNELPSWPGSPQLNYSANKYKAFSTWSINMLMEWTRLDPVSDKEIKRNDAVYRIQGNRNPFIDHPELAEHIWGNLQGKPWPDGNVDPMPVAITAPENGSTIDIGTTVKDTPLAYTVSVKGQGLSKNLTVSMSDNHLFYVNTNTLTASEVNNGTSVIITFTADEVGTFNNIITLSNDDVRATFTVTATATPKGDNPPAVLGDSIMEDWEGCSSGGYWTQYVDGHQWRWDFIDAGIWGDSNKHGLLCCRMGKSSSSTITMVEDVEGGTSAIGFWAASYGSDGDANLQVEYSTNKGSKWNVLGDYTVTRGALQHIIMDVPLEGSARFRIKQTTGSRVNIDDITVYLAAEEVQVKGDVNGDGEVNIADVNAIIDAILSNGNNANCDVNEDGEVNIADVNSVIDIILGS